MSELIKLLERIAVALERIAAREDKSSKVDPADLPFPWGDPRIDARIRKKDNWKPGRWDPPDKRRPETYRELLNIGRSELNRQSSLHRPRMVGAKSVQSLDEVFIDAGLGDEWVNS